MELTNKFPNKRWTKSSTNGLLIKFRDKHSQQTHR